MPALSPTMSQGNVSTWEVNEGDEVSAGSILATIETDKATLEWENQDDGFVARILVEAGTKDIKVGTPLAILVEDENNISSFKDYSPGGETASAQQKPLEEDKATSQASKGNEPSDSQTAEHSGRKADGLRRLGPAARNLLQMHGLREEDVKASGPLGIMSKGDVLEAVQRGKASRSGPQEASVGKGDSQGAQRKSQDNEAKQKEQERAHKQQESKSVQPPHKQPAGVGSPSQGDEYQDIPTSQIRKIIAKRLLEAKNTVPHYYVKATADLDAATFLRKTLKAQGTKVSVNDFVVRAVGLALAEVPEANAVWDAKSEEPRLMEGVDVAIAVATDKGLITPIVKAANSKSLAQISKEVRELAEKAKANKLKPEEFQGGTFSISNLGMFGIDHFAAVTNLPQAGILAVGGTQEGVVLENGHAVTKLQMKITLSADQRVYDGHTAARFLQAVCANLENPIKLLM